MSNALLAIGMWESVAILIIVLILFGAKNLDLLQADLTLREKQILILGLVAATVLVVAAFILGGGTV